MLEIMEIILFAIDKEIKMYTVKGKWQLDDTIQSKIMAMVFAMAAEIERDLISQRTKEALRVKKANGMILGRPKGPGKSKLDISGMDLRATRSGKALENQSVVIERDELKSQEKAKARIVLKLGAKEDFIIEGKFKGDSGKTSVARRYL